jgi:hypothetical protein
LAEGHVHRSQGHRPWKTSRTQSIWPTAIFSNFLKGSQPSAGGWCEAKTAGNFGKKRQRASWPGTQQESSMVNFIMSNLDIDFRHNHPLGCQSSFLWDYLASLNQNSP